MKGEKKGEEHRSAAPLIYESLLDSYLCPDLGWNSGHWRSEWCSNQVTQPEHLFT